jgi:predicted small metal-binding protein
MAKMESEKKQKSPATSKTENGRINSSSPTSGTEGYGMQRGGFLTHEGPGPEASSPNAEGAGDVRKTSYPLPEGSELMENESREDALRKNPNARQGKQFRCVDLGHMNCNWSVVAENEDEVIRRAEQHGREAHGIKGLDENAKEKIRGAIRDKAA